MDPILLKWMGYCAIFIFALALTIVYLSFRYNLFQSFKVEELELGSGNLLFVPFKGDYTQISKFFTPVMEEISATFGKDTKYFGIYYDNPQLLKNKNEARAIIGAYFESSVDLKPFILNHPTYKTTSFKNLKGFGAKFPLHTSLNVLSAVIRGYPAIKQYGLDKKLASKVLCSMELYDYPKKTMIISFPYHQGNESILFQSGYPIPESKSNSLKKDE